MAIEFVTREAEPLTFAYRGPDEGLYTLTGTGHESGMSGTGIWFHRIELPPGDQVPCGMTPNWSLRSAWQQLPCPGWTDRGWVKSTRLSTRGFMCDNCWEELQRRAKEQYESDTMDH